VPFFPGDPFVVLQIFANGDFPRLAGVDIIVDPLEKAPAIRKVTCNVVVVTVSVANIDGGIEAQAVQAVFVQPKERVVADELPHFTPAVIGAGITPRGTGAAVIIEIDSSVMVGIGPPIKAPQVEIARTKVIVNHIKNNRDAVRVGRLDEPVKALWPAQRRFHRERLRRIVTPGVIH